MSNSTKVVLIIPYMGKWPSHFPLYLKGCAGNPWLDVFFFTDCPIPADAPPNVRFIPFSLPEVSALATDKLGFRVSIRSSYKLCDLRPFYGLIFEDYLGSCDYWGYGDIDLVYGRMEPFYLPKLQQGYDVISSRHELLSGSFSLFKNSRLVCELGYSLSGYQSHLDDEKYVGLDETYGSHITWTGRSKLELPPSCMTYQAALAAEEGRLKACFETVCREYCDPGEVITYESPELSINAAPFAYYHYITDKGKTGFKIPYLRTVPDLFYLMDSGYYTPKTLKWLKPIRFWRKYSSLVLSFWTRGRKKIKRVLLQS